jgi:hypothetical protein
MPDEGQACRRVVGKEPRIAVRAAVELLDPGLIGLRTARGVLQPIRRDDAVSGLAQSGDDAGSEGIGVAACCFIEHVGDDPLAGWGIGSRHCRSPPDPGNQIIASYPELAASRLGLGAVPATDPQPQSDWRSER